MPALAAACRPASEDEVAQALGRLDCQPGLYFGCDRGIPGLHPLQAVLVDRPALALQVSTAGVLAQSLSPLGDALLEDAAVSAWRAASRPGVGRRPLASLRELLRLVGGAPATQLVGALGFAAHRLAGEACAPAVPLGVMYLPESLLERDAQGAWQRVDFDLPGQGAPGAQAGRLGHTDTDTDGRTVAAGAGTPPAPALTGPLTAGVPASTPSDDFAPGGHADMVRRALDHLRNPALVSLTLSQSFRRPFAGSAAAAFARLREANPAPVSFFLNDGEGGRLFGASPDLQLVIEGRSVASLPVCGTMARRAGAVGEAQSTLELMNEAVDAASLAVCSDALRNDLAPLCVPGSLTLTDRRRPMALATVVHTVDRLCGQLREGCDAWDAVAATAAPAMLTGTPRAAALTAIDALECSPRGWYGGLMVQVRADGSARVGTLLRAAWIVDGVAEVRTGGDLLADSDPAREEEESRIKAVSLWRALGLSQAGDARLAAPGSLPTAAPAMPAALELHASDDPFEAAVRDTLLAAGCRLADPARRASQPAAGALPAVLVSPGAAACAQFIQSRGSERLLAWGDAACHLLALHGWRTTPVTPAQGRIAQCVPAPDGPWTGPSTQVGRYGMWTLAGDVPAGWSIWARDDAGAPLAVAHAQQRCVALLYRPDSLLCGPASRGWLADALAWICA